MCLHNANKWGLQHESTNSSFCSSIRTDTFTFTRQVVASLCLERVKLHKTLIQPSCSSSEQGLLTVRTHRHPLHVTCPLEWSLASAGWINIWLVNTTAADGESYRQKDASIWTYVYMCVNYVHIILKNGGLHVSITAPSAPPSGQVHPPLLGKLLILFIWSK